jgi:hypothetical protein
MTAPLSRNLPRHLPRDHAHGEAPDQDGEAPGERRWAARVGTARLVRVEHEGGFAFASCNEISDCGMALRLGAPLPLDGAVTVALSPSLGLRGRVVWVRGNDCGIVFDRPTDCETLISSTGLDLRAAKFRSDAPAGARHRMPEPRRTADAPHRPALPAPAAPQRGFRPGLGVTVMCEGGREEKRLLCLSGSGTSELLPAAPAPAGQFLLPPPR